MIFLSFFFFNEERKVSNFILKMVGENAALTF